MAVEHRQYQHDGLKAVAEAWEAGKKRVLYVLSTGGGKCFRQGTPVMMSDGSTKAVEDVAVGDAVMGPDSKPRRVLVLARGRGAMYQVKPVKGDPYVVNRDHVLSLKMTPTVGEPEHRVVNITVADYLRQNMTFRHRAKGWRAPIDFPAREVPIDPYFIGLWLADGAKDTVRVTKPDDEVRDYMGSLAAKFGMVLKKTGGNASKSCPTWAITKGTNLGGHKSNAILDILRSLNLTYNKHVPDLYKMNSREVRLGLLAGILDGDGSLNHNKYDFCSTIQSVADSVAFIARSLGLAAYITQRVTRSQYGTPCTSWRVSISGDVDVIPCRIARKKAAPRLQKKSVLVTGIDVRELPGEDDYFGFQVEGDGLFVLGDFTVVHNCTVFCIMTDILVRKGRSMMVMAHRRLLVQNLAERLLQFNIPFRVEMANLPNKPWARQDENPQVYIASKDTLLSRCRNKDWSGLPQTDILAIDECHHVEQGEYKELAHNCPAKWWVGFTATPIRPDGSGLGKDSWDHLVQVAGVKQLIDMGFLVPMDVYTTVEVGNKRRNGDRTTGVVGDPLKWWRQYSQWRPTLGFCRSVAEARHIAAQFNDAGIPAAVLSYQSGNDERAEVLGKLKEGKLLWVGNSYLLGEGVDIPEVGCLQLLRKCMGFRDFVQVVGRGMRACKAIGKTNCILIDHSGAAIAHRYPDLEVEWRLDEAGKDFKDRRKREAEEKLAPACVCVSCGGLFAGRPTCPYCGTPVPQSKRRTKPKVERGVLTRVGLQSASSMESYEQRQWNEVLYVARARGWTLRQAGGMFFSKTKIYPSRANVTPNWGWDCIDRRVDELIQERLARAKDGAP